MAVGENFGKLVTSKIWWGKVGRIAMNGSFSLVEICYAELKNRIVETNLTSHALHENGSCVCNIIKCGERIPQM